MSRSVPSMPTSSTRTRHSFGLRFGAGTSAIFAELACFGVTTTARIEVAMVSPEFIDITIPLTDGMAVYPGEPGPLLTPLARIANGDPANVSHLSLGTHTGTHLDLRRVTPGKYDLWCLPLKVVGADGAPCRAVLSSRRKR